MKIKSLSKQEARKYKPTGKSLMISIQDYEKKYLPFKERTNHITRRLYQDIMFLYFDDINNEDIRNGMSSATAFTDEDALHIIRFLERHYAQNDFDEIIIHCEAGMSRSHAIALFIAMYFENDNKLFNKLLYQEGKLFGGNELIYISLLKNYISQKVVIETTFSLTINNYK